MNGSDLIEVVHLDQKPHRRSATPCVELTEDVGASQYIELSVFDGRGQDPFATILIGRLSQTFEPQIALLGESIVAIGFASQVVFVNTRLSQVAAVHDITIALHSLVLRRNRLLAIGEADLTLLDLTGGLISKTSFRDSVISYAVDGLGRLLVYLDDGTFEAVDLE